MKPNGVDQFNTNIAAHCETDMGCKRIRLPVDFSVVQLDDNRIDLFIDVELPHKGWYVKQELYQEEFVCVVNANSDCMASLPKRTAQKCAQSMGLKLPPPPIDVIEFTISMFWRQRHHNSPQHQRLRHQLIEATQGFWG